MSLGLLQSVNLAANCGVCPSSSVVGRVDEQLSQFANPKQVEKIKKKTQEFYSSLPDNVSLLTGGRGTSRIIKFEANSHSLICRIVDKARPDFFLDTQTEITNMQLVDPLQVAPKLHYASVKSDIIIMDYVPPMRVTETLLDNQEKSKALYVELASKLKKLHGGPALPVQSSDIFDDIDHTIKQGNQAFMPKVALETLDRLEELKKALRGKEEIVPAHKDLHSNNVIFDGKNIFFIDWELAAMADRYIDLACASIFFIFDPRKENEFLTSYFGADPTPKQKAQFYLMKQVCLCCYGFRLLRRVTGIEKIDLKQNPIDQDSLPNFRDFILQNYNGCSKVFSPEELKVFPYMFLNEAEKGFQSTEYSQALKTLMS